jgi:hypothetical protein
MIDGSEPVANEFAALWAIQRFPVIVDDGQFVFEATGIIEYLEARFPETARLIPANPPLAAEVRMWNRFFDNYVSYDTRGGFKWRARFIPPCCVRHDMPGALVYIRMTVFSSAGRTRRVGLRRKRIDRSISIVVEAEQNSNRAVFPLKSKAKKFDGLMVGL